MVERFAVNEDVRGSSPCGGAKSKIVVLKLLTITTGVILSHFMRELIRG